MSKPSIVSCAKALSLSSFLAVTAVSAANSPTASSTNLQAQKPVLDMSLPASSSVPTQRRVPAPNLDDQSVAGPDYGKPLGETIEREAAAPVSEPSSVASAASVQADGATLAPFHRANNSFAPLRGMQLPRPLNIPRDASPALKEAASMISNMSVVSPNLIRGAQPTVPALSVLKSAGVKTIINLRNEPILVAQEAGAAKRAGLNYINIPMALFETPTKQQFQKFLSAVDNNGPVFVHCQMGEDRTGTMVAVYRMAREGWDANRAYQEMTSMGFKTFLGSLKGAVFEYSAMLGRPARLPAPDFGGFASILRH